MEPVHAGLEGKVECGRAKGDRGGGCRRGVERGGDGWKSEVEVESCGGEGAEGEGSEALRACRKGEEVELDEMVVFWQGESRVRFLQRARASIWRWDSPVLPDKSATPNTLAIPTPSKTLSTPSSPVTDDLRLVDPIFGVHLPASLLLCEAMTTMSEKTKTCTLVSLALVLTTRLDERRTGMVLEKAEGGT